MSRKANTMATELNGKKKELKYLFHAHFLDNNRIEQNQEDRSVTREGGSQFTDVLAYQEKSKLTNFALVGNDRVVEVDLTTGAFFVDGQSIFLGEVLPDEDIHNPKQTRDFKLVFFRRNYDNHVIPAQIYDPKDWKILDSGELEIINSQGERLLFPTTTRCDVSDYEVGEKKGKLFTVWPTENSVLTHYYVGWEINIAGKTYKQMVRLV